MTESAFGIEHGEISKLTHDQKRNTAVAAGGTAAGVGVLAGTKMPEHSHYSRSTRKYIKSLPAGEHDLPTKMLSTKPRKLGARKQQRSYVAAMAQERPAHTYSPVPITRYKDGVIQRDNAHSVMAHAMKGRKTVRVKVEDAPGYRPSRRTGEELVRRGQARYQQHRLKAHTDLPEKKINSLVSQYKPKSRAANTSKRPHGVVEDTFKYSKKPFRVARALGIAKSDRDRRNLEAGAAGTAGVGVLASTPVRRSAAKVKISDGKIKSSDAKKIVNPGYRPGNKRAIKTMARNLGHLENKPTTVIRYKDGGVIPFDGNHRATARVVRGDKKIPVKVVEGGERPAVSVGRNAYHVAQQKLHQNRINRGVFNPRTSPKKSGYTGKHSGETKVYGRIANGSPSRSGKRVAIGSTKIAAGPTKALLRTKQGAAVATGAALLGTAEYLHRKDRP